MKKRSGPFRKEEKRPTTTSSGFLEEETQDVVVLRYITPNGGKREERFLPAVTPFLQKATKFVRIEQAKKKGRKKVEKPALPHSQAF